jgi:hypothetical protein
MNTIDAEFGQKKELFAASNVGQNKDNVVQQAKHESETITAMEICPDLGPFDWSSANIPGSPRLSRLFKCLAEAVHVPALSLDGSESEDPTCLSKTEIQEVFNCGKTIATAESHTKVGSAIWPAPDCISHGFLLWASVRSNLPVLPPIPRNYPPKVITLYSSRNIKIADTDMTSSPEEEEWEFQLTPDMERRLSLIPSRNHGNTLPSLPTELQLEVFSYLDKIDSCCLGLSAPNLYLVYRAIYGTKMLLNTRRISLLEVAWEVVGSKECKQCGVFRCELYQHIKSWMPKELGYYAFKQNFGITADNNTHATCYRGKPSKPKRCGRHPLRTPVREKLDWITRIER